MTFRGKKIIIQFLFCLLLIQSLTGCHYSGGAAKNEDVNSKRYHLRLNAPEGANYHYEIENQTKTVVTVNDEDRKTESLTRVEFDYHVSRDSSGNLLLAFDYQNIALDTKTKDSHTVAEASPNILPLTPVEKMLDLMRKAKIVVVVRPTGEIAETRGYDELGRKIIALFDANDNRGREFAAQQWEGGAGGGMLRSNFSQLFEIFPDSTIKLGDTWRMKSMEKGEIPFQVKGTFTLKDVNDDFAVIDGNGTLESDTLVSILGQNDVQTKLEGKQDARLELESKTGVLLNSKINIDLKGTLILMGEEVPVEITTKISIKGKRLN